MPRLPLSEKEAKLSSLLAMKQCAEKGIIECLPGDQLMMRSVPVGFACMGRGKQGMGRAEVCGIQMFTQLMALLTSRSMYCSCGGIAEEEMGSLVLPQYHLHIRFL